MRTTTTTFHAVLITAMATAAVASPPAPQPGPAGRLAAQGPGLAISVEELRDEVRDSRRSGDMARVAATLTADGLERIVTALADQKRLAGEARRRGIDRLPEVSREIESVTNALLADALEGQVRAQAEVSAAAVRAFYEANADQFRTPGRRKARHIVVATEAEAREALQAVRAGASFATVASQRNVDSTRKTGGDLGWVPRGLMVSVFENLLFGTPAGEVGGPVHTSQGWHVVLVEDVDPGTLPELPLIEDTVIETMKRQAFADVRARLRADQPVSIDRAVVEELLK